MGAEGGLSPVLASSPSLLLSVLRLTTGTENAAQYDVAETFSYPGTPVLFPAGGTWALVCPLGPSAHAEAGSGTRVRGQCAFPGRAAAPQGCSPSCSPAGSSRRAPLLGSAPLALLFPRLEFCLNGMTPGFCLSYALEWLQDPPGRPHLLRSDSVCTMLYCTSVPHLCVSQLLGI